MTKRLFPFRVGAATADWGRDAVAPQVLSMPAIATNPRNTVILSEDVTLSEPIDLATFDRHDLTLTRNDGANLIDSRVTVEYVAGSTCRIKGDTFSNDRRKER